MFGRPLFMTANFDLFTSSQRSTAQRSEPAQPTNVEAELKRIRSSDDGITQITTTARRIDVQLLAVPQNVIIRKV